MQAFFLNFKEQQKKISPSHQKQGHTLLLKASQTQQFFI